MNTFIMESSVVRPATNPYGRLERNSVVGYEGEHNARSLVVETTDDLSAYASVSLIIDDLDCGAMTKTTSGSKTVLSLTLTSAMIGASGRKLCQLLMVDSNNTVIAKSSQFVILIKRSNDIERSVEDGVSFIIISEAVTEMAQEAASAAAEEAAADVVAECQTIANTAAGSASAAAQSAAAAQAAAESIVVDSTLDTGSTNAIQNKAVAGAISELRADLGDKVGVIGSVKGYYINLTTDPVDIANPTPTAWGLAYSIIDCAEGDKFVVNAVGGSTGRAWGFLDSSNHVLSMADTSATVTDLELTAPENAIKLIINDRSGGISYKVENNLVSRVSEIKKGSGLSDDAKGALLACFRNMLIESENGAAYYNTLKATILNDYETCEVENGTVALADGTDGESDIRARTDFIPCTGRSIGINALINGEFEVSYAARYFDANKQYIQNIYFDTSVMPPIHGSVGSGWYKGDGTIYDVNDSAGIEDVAYVRFLMRSQGGTETITKVNGTITVDGVAYKIEY